MLQILTNGLRQICQSSGVVWDMEVLACVTFLIWKTCVPDIGRSQLLKYRTEILELLTLLAEKTKSERGYAGTGRLIHRILHTLSAIYPINARFANADEWDDPGKSCCSICNNR